MKKLMSAFVACAFLALTGCYKKKNEESRPVKKQEYMKKDDKKKDVLREHKTREHVCAACDMKFKTKEDMDMHREKMHGKKMHRDHKAHEKNHKMKKSDMMDKGDMMMKKSSY